MVNPSVLPWVWPASTLGPPSPFPARFRGHRLRGPGPCEAGPGLTARGHRSAEGQERSGGGGL